MQRQTALACVVPLLLALTACSDGGATDDAAPVEVDPCGALTDADVERLVGVAVTHEETSEFGLARCAFQSADGEDVISIIAERSTASAVELSEETGTGDDATVTEVEVGGATEAVYVVEPIANTQSTVLYATTGTVGYTFFGTGGTTDDEEQTSVALLSILLGEEPPADD